MINWQKTDTVLLDMDGTLLDLHFDNFFWQTHLPQRYAEIKKIDVQQAKQHIIEHCEHTHGTLDWYDIEYWNDYLQLDIMALKYEVRHLLRPRKGAIEFLTSLANTDCHIFLVTNCHPLNLDFKLNHVDIGGYFDKLISSHDLGYAKEQLPFWQTFTAEEKLRKQSCLLVDDNEYVLRQAKHYVGQVYGVATPDSTINEPKVIDDFHCIDNFLDYLPTSNH